MVTFIALYRGPDVQQAKVVAVSSNPALAQYVAGVMLEQAEETGDDPALDEVIAGRIRALRLLSKGEADNAEA